MSLRSVNSWNAPSIVAICVSDACWSKICIRPERGSYWNQRLENSSSVAH